MEEQVPASAMPDTGNPWGDFFEPNQEFGEPQPQFQPPVQQRQLTSEQIQLMKQAALQQAIQQRVAVQSPPPTPIPSQAQPQPLERPRVVYVRRNLTVAELILLFALSIGVVSGIQMLWSGVSGMLPRIEIKYDK